MPLAPEHHITDRTTTTTTTNSLDPEDSIINLHHRRRNFTALFSSSSSSSTSASVNRSSFASDFPDRDSSASASDSNQHLARRGSEGESSSGLESERDKCSTAHKFSNGFGCARDFKDRVLKQGSKLEIVEDASTNSMPVLFSLAVKDCQDRRFFKDDGKGYKKNISVGVKSSSPRLDALKKDSLPSRLTSNIPSPGTPTYHFPSVGMQKGWNSERMALPLKGNRVGPALLPLRNVKALPSKWEDAERWIFSPAYGDSSSSHRQLFQNQYHRKPKAKSGPLGPPGSAYYSMYMPVLPMSDRRSVGHDIMCDSPFSEGLAVKKVLSTSNEDLGKGSPARLDPWMPRSVSLRGCSVERPGQSSVHSSDVSADEKVDKMNSLATNLSCPQSRRDISTQMSSSDSTNSSFKRIPSSQNKEQAQSSFSKTRDVEMDEKITIGSLRNIHRSNQSSRSSRRVNDSTKKTIVPQSTTWGCKETAIGVRKSTSNEARIIAWENLQKEKADAAIQKLEMKLEKKKALSMNKIMKKLKSAQKKAIEMRMYMLSNQLDKASKSSGTDRSSSASKVRQRSSLSGCFTCHAFELP